ncbi:MAG: DUF721 domain-containing protein [Synergistaceae bacterium]|jgi:hypothetical protein|nr:DUF721 domain-containing protein [Synergistaceae bacterium]
MSGLEREKQVKRTKREGGERPIYSALGADSSIMRVCKALAVVEREWARIVGVALASRSALKAYEDGVLVISAEGQAALQDINFKKSFIMREIRTNARLKVSDVRVEQGYMHGGEMPVIVPAVRAHGRVRIDPEAEEAIKNEILSAHDGLDPDLARSIARCRIASERRASGKKRVII